MLKHLMLNMDELLMNLYCDHTLAVKLSQKKTRTPDCRDSGQGFSKYCSFFFISFTYSFTISLAMNWDKSRYTMVYRWATAATAAFAACRFCDQIGVSNPMARHLAMHKSIKSGDFCRPIKIIYYEKKPKDT